jgi:hypothetical protein
MSNAIASASEVDDCGEAVATVAERRAESLICHADCRTLRIQVNGGTATQLMFE